MKFIQAALTILALTSCTPTAAAHSLKVWCDAPDACPECMVALEEGDASKLRSHVLALDPSPHESMEELMREVAAAPAHERGTVLRNAARDAGLTECAMADWNDRPIVVESR